MFIGNLFKPLKVAFISTYPPRRCGIATYTADLTDNFRKIYSEGQSNGEQNYFEVIALNNTPQGYQYDREVSFHIRDQHRGDYQRAADFINVSPIDVVCLQHEFGIFGGEDGSYIIHLLRSLKKPVVTTFHTILAEPTPGQKKTFTRICELSTLVVVQAQMAVRLLEQVYDVPASKIVMIPHGAPDVPFLDSSFYKDRFQAEGRTLLLTFGLLGPNKGIEYAIAALEKVAAKYPEVLYIVLGATHPEIKRRYGEQYRHQLEQLVREKGLQKQITFYNQYVSLERLIEFLVATDIYLTPYVNKDQITSGTLAYALACGKVIVSTPYWYAQELLADGRGCLVPFRDSEALADKLIELLGDEAMRSRMRKLSYQYGRKMIWREVARNYAAAFEKALLEYSSVGKKSVQSLAVTESAVLPEIRLNHLRAMTDDTGLFQHALYTVPNRGHGYCIDDNARALIVTVMNWRLFKDEQICPLFRTYLSFLLDAYNRDAGRMRNFLSYQRRWQEEVGSEDSHGRSIWALGYTIAYPPDDSLLGLITRLFKQLLLPVDSFISPRAWAFTIIGALYYLKRFGGDPEVRKLLVNLSGQLCQQFSEYATEEWFWLEEIVTYDNARIPQALIGAGSYLQEQQILQTGLCALNWLISIQTNPAGGQLSLVGNNGWYRRGGEKAPFDQQPLDAAAMVAACTQAYLATGEPRWQIAMDWSFNWFFGNNDTHQTLYDFSSGGCYDGLMPGGVNMNQGGESTLSLLLALHEMHLTSHQGYAGVGEVAGTFSPSPRDT
ncbi:MAG: glycosyltransferase family 4 protein [Dethiobacteria bacterium]|jgi:glycosyltransferase involved in cell wall biosynthesis|nr:glycosyltransferase [Bacillota bacterium]HOB28266.1 glycosyltransferase family 4 protein [Bacillota bacterium]HQD51832.1 glycosyltransferase family 4 protein [Bacillota bacterium]